MIAGEHDNTGEDKAPSGYSNIQPTSAPPLAQGRVGIKQIPAPLRPTPAVVTVDQVELALATPESSGGNDAPGQGQLGSSGLSWYIGLDAGSKLTVIGPFTGEVARETQTVLTGQSRLYQADSKAEAQAAHLEFLSQVAAGQVKW